MSTMLGAHKLIVDEWAETWDLLKPYADGSFWQMPELDPANTYIIGRVLLKENWQTITDFANQHPGKIVFSNPAEGSETILLQLKRLRITDYVKDGRIKLLTSGDLEPGIRYCQTDCYFSNIVEYDENKDAVRVIEQHSYREAESAQGGEFSRPYSFLFLNGRLRPHRKALIDSLRTQGLLDRALWTNLNDTVAMPWSSQLQTEQTEPIRLLPEQYEIPRAIPNLASAPEHSFAKHHLFGNTWGDAIINPAAYTDTCFSLVSETIYDYPYTFRTEKIFKPILAGHPFIVASNAGYYESLRAAGFRTFGHLIDERFDTIDDPAQRLALIVDTVGDVIRNGAEDFYRAARDICVYNQNHLREYNAAQRRQLPEDLLQYLNV